MRYDSKNLLSHLSLPLISHDRMFIYLFRLITNPHNAIPSSSSLLPPPSSLLLPPSTTDGWHHASRPAKFQTCNVDEIMKGLKRRLTVFWAFRYFFLSSFMFINSSLLFRNKKMMSLLTAENRTRCQQGSRRSGLDERP